MTDYREKPRDPFEIMKRLGLVRADGTPENAEFLPDPVETIKHGLKAADERLKESIAEQVAMASAAAEIARNERERPSEFDFAGKLEAKRRIQVQKAKFDEAKSAALGNIERVVDSDFSDHVRRHLSGLEREFDE